MRAAALLIASCTALSPQASVLHRCGSKTPPSAAEATAALREIVAAPRQDDWAPLCDTRWRPVFSVKPDADEGRFLTVKAEQEFKRDGSFTNAIRLLGLKFVFAGTYALQRSTTTLVIERLRLKTGRAAAVNRRPGRKGRPRTDRTCPWSAQGR